MDPVTLRFPSDARICVVNRTGQRQRDGTIRWTGGSQWEREPDGAIVAWYDREPEDQLEWCLGACGVRVRGVGRVTTSSLHHGQ